MSVEDVPLLATDAWLVTTPELRRPPHVSAAWPLVEEALQPLGDDGTVPA